MSKYTRNCPNCNKSLYYSKKASLNRAIFNNSICVACSKPTIGIATLPDFKESLRILVEEEKYALVDIGNMFQVSRQRIHQLVDEYEFNYSTGRGIHSTRIWNDELHKFIPSTNKEIREFEKLENKLKNQKLRKQRKEKYRRRLISVTNIIKELRISLGKEPSWGNIEEAIFGENTTGANLRVFSYCYERTGRSSISKTRIQFCKDTGYRIDNIPSFDYHYAEIE